MNEKKKYAPRVFKKGTFVSILREITQADSGRDYLWFWARAEGKDYKVTVFDEQAESVSKLSQGDRITFHGSPSGDTDDTGRICFTASSVSSVSAADNTLATYAIERYGSLDAMREARRKADQDKVDSGLVKIHLEGYSGPAVWERKENTVQYKGQIIRKIDFVGEVLGWKELTTRLRAKHFHFIPISKDVPKAKEYHDYLESLVTEANDRLTRSGSTDGRQASDAPPKWEVRDTSGDNKPGPGSMGESAAESSREAEIKLQIERRIAQGVF